MSEKRIHIVHHVDDYECMWNGIEDLYMSKTNEHLPDFFFFALAGLGNFVYLKNAKGSLKRQAVWNDGRTKHMYQLLAPIVGFTYQYTEGTSFPYMLRRAKQSIDAGDPVVLGCLDMYYLHYYPKFYQRAHVPIHYVFMVGYDEEQRCIYIHDCGVADVQKLSYEDLENALNVEKTALSDKNTMCVIRFSEQLPSVYEIARKALSVKAHNNLQSPVSFLGIKGMRKLAKDFCKWENELSAQDYRNALLNTVMFTGTVPMLPDCLLQPEERSGILHRAAREKLVHVLYTLSERYHIPAWAQSARLFDESGDLLAHMTDRIRDHLLGNCSNLDDIPKLIIEIAEIEERAFVSMLEGANDF